jgi:outer membrane protein assembly factor BamC
MNRRIFIFSLLSLSISACSGLNSAKHANGGFEYVKIKEQAPLVIPPPLKEPEYKQDYQVNNKVAPGPTGEKIDVRSPALVLPIAASTRVEPDSKAIKIWFDKVLEDKDLTEFILSALKEKVTNDGVDFTVVDAQQHTYQSGWYHNTEETGLWFWSDVKVKESMRFQYQLETKPHGRSVALTVKLIAYKNEETGDTQMDPIDQQRAEVSMLNNVIGYVDYKYRQYQKENRLMKATQKIVSISENSIGEPAYLIDMREDYVWSNLPAFFEKYGFEIHDLNESKRIYYVNFVKPDASLWDSIWGDAQPVIDLPEQKYQFALSKIDGKQNKTIISIYDEAGNALDQETLTRIFDVVEPGLSFRVVN